MPTSEPNYEVQITEMRKDISYLIGQVAELKEAQKWVSRLIIGAVIVAMLALVLKQ